MNATRNLTRPGYFYRVVTHNGHGIYSESAILAAAHEVVLTMGIGNPDDAGAHVAQEHRRLLRERILLAIAGYLQES